MARQFAADPEATDYAPGPAPRDALQREHRDPVEARRRDQLDDVHRRPGLQRRRRHAPAREPVLRPRRRTRSRRAAATGPTSRVKENDLPSLFGAIGLPLPRNVARARIEIRPALSGQQVPAARGPEQRDREGAGALLRRVPRPGPLVTARDRPPNLVPLRPPTRRASFQPAEAPSGAFPSAAESRRSATPAALVAPTVPSYGGCGQDYLPIGVQVRLASTAVPVDINQSCAP